MRQELTQTKEQLKEVTYVLLNLGYLSSSSHRPSPQDSTVNEDNENDEDNDHIRLDGI